VGEQKPVIEVMDSCIEVVKKLLANLMLRDADSCRECWHFANGPPAQTAPLAMTYRPNQRPGPIRRYDHLRMTPTVGPDAAPNLRRLLPWTPALRRLPPWLRHFMRPTSSRVNGIRQEGGKARPVVRRRRTSPDAGRRATRRSGPAPGASRRRRKTRPCRGYCVRVLSAVTPTHWPAAITASQSSMSWISSTSGLLPGGHRSGVVVPVESL
jgi:hypothetical protein